MAKKKKIKFADGPRFPEVQVELLGCDGNAYAILGATKKAMRKAGVPQAEIDGYLEDAMGGDYNHLLATTMRYVEVI